MAYREQTSCELHPLSCASVRCDDCGRALCDSCVSFAGTAQRCTACARRSDTRRGRVARLQRAALFTLGIAVSLSTGLVLGMTGFR